MPRERLHERTGVRLAIAVLVAIATTLAWTLLSPRIVPVLNRGLAVFGDDAALGYVLIAGVAIALCAPASLLYITAGTIFGMARGVLLGSAAAAIGTSLAFAIARTTLGGRVARAIAKSARLDRFEQALSQRGLLLIVLLRLSLLFPIGPVSYALGVMRIPVKHFALALPAVVPTVIVYAYGGHIARSVLDERAAARAPWEWAVLAVGFVATALVTFWIGQAATGALRRSIAPPPSPRRDACA